MLRILLEHWWSPQPCVCACVSTGGRVCVSCQGELKAWRQRLVETGPPFSRPLTADHRNPHQGQPAEKYKTPAAELYRVRLDATVEGLPPPERLTDEREAQFLSDVETEKSRAAPKESPDWTPDGSSAWCVPSLALHTRPVPRPLRVAFRGVLLISISVPFRACFVQRLALSLFRLPVCCSCVSSLSFAELQRSSQ